MARKTDKKHKKGRAGNEKRKARKQRHEKKQQSKQEKKENKNKKLTHPALHPAQRAAVLFGSSLLTSEESGRGLQIRRCQRWRTSSKRWNQKVRRPRNPAGKTLHQAGVAILHPAGKIFLHPAGKILLHPAGRTLLHPAEKFHHLLVGKQATVQDRKMSMVNQQGGALTRFHLMMIGNQILHGMGDLQKDHNGRIIRTLGVVNLHLYLTHTLGHIGRQIGRQPSIIMGLTNTWSGRMQSRRRAQNRTGNGRPKKRKKMMKHLQWFKVFLGGHQACQLLEGTHQAEICWQKLLPM